MKPYISILHLPFATHTLIFIIALLVALLGVTFVLKKENIKLKDIFYLIALLYVSGFLCSIFIYVIVDYKTVFHTHTLGRSSHGGLLGCILGIIIFSRQYKISFWKLMDLVIPIGALVYAIGRIGCYLAGCCSGIETNALWAVVFPLSRLHPEYTSVHPVQLYDSYLNFLLFLFLLEYRHKKKFDGQLFLLFLIGNSAIRFFVEYFRWGVSAKVAFGIITQAQIASIVIIIFSLVFMKILANKRIL